MRIECDFLGEAPIPIEAYWGIHTQRAVENFPIAGIAISRRPELIRIMALIKKAAAMTNMELDHLDRGKGSAIVRACGEIAEGSLHDQFIVDVIQGGAGTSTNMNANEVIANRALEILGYEKGGYEFIHPINDVNASQSTHDVYPTALRLSICMAMPKLLLAISKLRDSFHLKAKEFHDYLKIGRTQLQDAVPMTLGQEFLTYAVMLDEDEARLREVVELLSEINLGGTAIGTGINANVRYAARSVELLSELSGIKLKSSENLIEATQDCGVFVQLSGVLKRNAVKVSKICNDLRLLSSGPQLGFNEISLPPRAAGSSIMPGKVNPIIPEVVNQVAFEVIGNDITVTMAAEAGQLQLNAFEPIIAHRIYKSMEYMICALETLRKHCVDGITANKDRLFERMSASAGLATALNPYIGYEKACDIAKRTLSENRSILELVLELGLLGAEEVSRLLSPATLTNPSK